MTPIPWYLVFAGAWGASPPPAASSPPPPQLPSLALFFLAPMQNLSSTLAMRRGGLEIFFFLLTERNFLAPWFIHENITGDPISCISRLVGSGQPGRIHHYRRRWSTPMNLRTRDAIHPILTSVFLRVLLHFHFLDRVYFLVFVSHTHQLVHTCGKKDHSIYSMPCMIQQCFITVVSTWASRRVKSGEKNWLAGLGNWQKANLKTGSG